MGIHINKFKLCLIIILFQGSLYCQDTSRIVHEGGLNLVNAKIPTHLGYSYLEAPYFQFLYGFFYRVNRNRTAFRLICNYSENRKVSLEDFVIIFYQTARVSKSKDFLFAGGLQYLPFKRRRYLYCFSDLYYRNMQARGELIEYGNKTNSFFFTKSIRIGLNAGVGFKVNFFKRLHLSTEIFGDLFYTQSVFDLEDKNTNTKSHHSGSGEKLKPNAKLLFTVDL